MKTQSLKRMIFCALMVAMTVVLSRILCIQTPATKISFSFFPVAMAAMLYGPLWGAICGGMADMIGALMFPVGAFNPMFSVTAAITGLIYGICYHRKFSKGNKAAPFLWAFAGSAANAVIVTLLANTLLLYLYFNMGFVATIGSRIAQVAILVPVQTAALGLIGFPLRDMIEKLGLGGK